MHLVDADRVAPGRHGFESHLRVGGGRSATGAHGCTLFGAFIDRAPNLVEGHRLERPLVRRVDGNFGSLKLCRAIVMREASAWWMRIKPMRGGLREKAPKEVTMPSGKKRRPRPR